MSMLRMYCLITGDDYEILKNDTPASRKKVAVQANCLMIPVMMWFATSYLVVTEVMHLSATRGLQTAFFTALLIFLLERSIIMANGNGLLVAFRLILGAIVALLGSIGLDEVVFKKDIDHQLHINKMTYVKAELDTLQRQRQQEVEARTQVVEQRYQIWQEALNKAHQEASGEGLTGKRGYGPVTNLIVNRASQAKAEYDRAKNELAEYQTGLKKDLENKQKEALLYYSDHSLLLRINALFDLVKTNRSMALVYWLFTGLLFILEFLVILVKMTHRKTNYDRKVFTIEKISEKQALNLV
ncbi:hypothetical protein GCM10028803_49020 [Larkinella knui]|uniref:DUF4407 domain-containing protein n=1 Tax=Larkinella knui TaxID=2025310 RepID=A0A3P1CQ65_9BACT|nr:DUF4407 domain-containing protein [Larkinella knui]RRB15472.1 DUF4407 domain-containing protein [Larkinella knui]